MSLRLEFLLKTDSGYPKDTGVTTCWQTLGIPFAITSLVLLYHSALAHSRGRGHSLLSTWSVGSVPTLIWFPDTFLQTTAPIRCTKIRATPPNRCSKMLQPLFLFRFREFLIFFFLFLFFLFSFLLPLPLLASQAQSDFLGKKGVFSEIL